LDDLYKEMDSLVQHFFADEGSTNGSRDFMPSLNVAENEEGYEVTMDLPGVKPDEVSVELHDNQLTISGKREAESEETGKTYHRVERRYGEFRRVVTMPAAVDEGKITADYQQGVLRISLPKSEEVKPTKIPIKS
jgi:HSP20 family protein